ncbi:collectin-10-like [Lethenteron reissneri]|uniref:collectin-10-like n=1 Tax=Lethenteron reissneri TaxID=7753 RepID=UPI002AB67F27|nr:collectin-10-like [Lethenteron reissneri]
MLGNEQQQQLAGAGHSSQNRLCSNLTTVSLFAMNITIAVTLMISVLYNFHAIQYSATTSTEEGMLIVDHLDVLNEDLVKMGDRLDKKIDSNMSVMKQEMKNDLLKLSEKIDNRLDKIDSNMSVMKQEMKNDLLKLSEKIEYILHIVYWPVYEKKTFEMARAHCKKYGGDLAMPTSSILNKRLHNYICNDTMFIGMNNITNEKIFRYVNETPLGNYTNWKSGEPNAYNGKEECVEMRTDGLWNDVPCTWGLQFLCQKFKKD